jgi:sugar phosphate isomerase/epimerase
MTHYTADMRSLSRRHFLQSASALVLGAPFVGAIEPFVRSGGSRLRLGLAAYSFRDYFKHSTHKQQPIQGERTLTVEKFLDHCAEWNVDGAELTSYYFPKDVTDAQLAEVRRHAHLRGVTITGTSVGNTFTHPPGADRDKELADVKKWIDRAVILGAPHIRVFAGNVPKGGNFEDAKKTCIEQLEECAAYAGKHGIFLGIENHHGIVAEPKDLIDIVKAVKSPWVGINLDTGNFNTPDPYADLVKIAPYAVNVQVKTEIKPRGAKEKQPADLNRLVKIVRDSGYRGWVTLEYEALDDPWKSVPVVLEKLRPLLADRANAVAAAAPAGWQPLFDGKSLGAWKETDFAGKGEVAVKDGQLILNVGGDLTGVNLAAAPATMNYEVEFQAMRVEGDDFFVGFTFPVADKHVTFIAGGWGGSVTGISNVGSENASENETTQFKKYDNGKWYQVRVKVTQAKLEAWIDKEQVVDLELDGKQLGMRVGEIESSLPFGFATWRTKAAYKDLRWRKL